LSSIAACAAVDFVVCGCLESLAAFTG